MLGSIPYLSSPTNGSPLGAVLHACIMRRPYPCADKGTQVPCISQHRTQKWWYGDAEMEHPAHPVGAEPHRFGNCGHNCLDPHDFCCVVSQQFKIVIMIP
jgi:hypothetical protein